MPKLLYEPHPDIPGWMGWTPDAGGSFFDVIGKLAVRPEQPGSGRVRWWPAPLLTNMHGALHGGALLGFVDIALFAGARGAGVEGAQRAVTVECSTQFIAPAQTGSSLDALVEVLRETIRMVFLRGLIEQQDRIILSFSAVIRKVEEA